MLAAMLYYESATTGSAAVTDWLCFLMTYNKGQPHPAAAAHSAASPQKKLLAF